MAACRLIISPISGKEVTSRTWNDIYNLVDENEEQADKLYEQLLSPQFVAWFGDWVNNPSSASKVVNDLGEPLVVYHGTGNEFEVFNKTSKDFKGRKSPTAAFHFTTNEYSEDYKKRYGGKIVPTFLNLKNPYTTKDYEKWLEYPSETDILKSKKEGYDGGIMGENEDREFIAFDSNQIKSVLNRGSFLSEVNTITIEPKASSDGEEYSIKVFDGTKEIGVVLANNDGTYLTVDSTQIDGLQPNSGTNAYLKIAQFARDNGLTFRSDRIYDRMSAAAQRLWTRFVNAGQAEIIGNHYEFTGDPSAVTNNIYFNLEEVSPQQVFNNVLKGFELYPSQEGFTNSYVSKNYKTSPDLANRINKWINDQGWSGVSFKYEKTYNTVNAVFEETRNKDLDIKRKYFFTSNTRSSKNILSDIAQSSHPLKDLARKLLDYSDTFNVPVNLVEEPIPSEVSGVNPSAFYNLDNKNIFVYQFADFKGASSEPTLIHEIIHSYTARFVKENPYHPLIWDLRRAYNYLVSDESKFKDKYPLSDLDEFITGFFTNGKFIKDLQKMPAINKFNNYKNLWQEVLDYIMNLFRFDPKSKSMYEELFPLMTNVIEESANYENSTFDTQIEQYYETHDSLVDEYAEFEELQSAENVNDLQIIADEINDNNPDVHSEVIQDYEHLDKVKITSFSKNNLPDEYRRIVDKRLLTSEITYVTLEKVAQRLEKVFPEINIQFINQFDLDQVDHEIPIHQVRSFIRGNTAYLVKDVYSQEDKIEELLHPFVLGLSYKNPEIFDTIYNEVKDKYQETQQFYSKLGDDVAKLEVVTKAIRDTLINQGKPSWLSSIINFIRNAIRKLFPRSTISKLSTDITVEDLGKMLLNGGFKFETHFTNRPFYSANTNSPNNRKVDIVNKLKGFATSVGLNKVGKDEGYEYNGKKVKRTSQIIQEMNNEKFKNSPISEQQKILFDIVREDGTEFHAIIEDIIHRYVDPVTNLLRSQPILNKNLNNQPERFYDRIEEYISDLLGSYEPGTVFLSETVLANLKKRVKLTDDQVQDNYSRTGEASTIDFIAVTPQGKIHVLDWKFISSFKKDQIPQYKKDNYNTQLGNYVETIRQITGARREDFEKVQIIPFLVSYTDENYTAVKGLLTPSIDLSNLKSKRQIPFISTSQYIPVKELSTLIDKLNKLPVIEAERARQLEGKGFKEDFELKSNIEEAISKILLADDNFDGDIGNLLEIHEKVYHDAVEIVSYLDEVANNPIDENNKVKIYNQLNNAFQLISAINSFKHAAQYVYGKNYDKKINKTEEEETLKDSIRNFNTRIETLEDDFEKLNNKINSSFAEHNKIYGLEKEERRISGFTKAFTFMSTPKTKAVALFSKVIQSLSAKLDKIIDSGYLRINSIRSNIQKEASAKGQNLRDIIELLIDRGEEGKGNPKLKGRIKPEFWADKAAVLKKGKVSELKEFFGKYYRLNDYETWATKRLQEEIDRINSTNVSAAQKKSEIAKKKLRYDLSNAQAYTHISTSFYLDENDTFKNDYYTDFGKSLLDPKNISLKEFYDYMIVTNKKLVTSGLVPYDEVNSYTFIPNIDKGLIERFGSGELAPKDIYRTWLDQFRVTPNSGLYGYVDPITGMEQKKVFAPYVEDYFNGDYSRKSTDLFEVYGLFQEGLEKAIAMKDVSPFAESLLRTESSKKVIPVTSFGVIKKKFGLWDEDLNPVTDSANAKYLEQFVDALVYGKTVQDSLDYRWTTSEGNTYSAAKIIQNGMGFMYKTTFGLNVFTPIRQYIESLVSAGLLKGRDFSGTELFGFENFMGAITTPSGKLDDNTNKLASLIGYFLPYNNQQFSKKADNLSINKLKSWTSPENLMWFMEKSDRAAQIHMIYALLKNTIIIDGRLQNANRYVNSLPEYQDYYDQIKGNPSRKSQLDAEIKNRISYLIKNNGIIGKTSIVDGSVQIEGLTKEEESITWFKNLAQNYTERATGMMSQYNFIGYKASIVGRLVGMYRSWIPRTVQTRLGKYSYNTKSDEYEWGRWLSYWNAISNTWKESRAKTIATILGFRRKEVLIEYAREKYFKVRESLDKNNRLYTEDFMSEKEFIDKYLNDIRNTINEFRFITGLLLAITMGLFAPGDDDDEVVKNIKNFAQFQANRMLSGFTFYINPSSFTSIVNNGVPAVSYLENLFRIPFFELPKELIGQLVSEDLADKAHPLKYIFKTLPVASEILKYISIFNPEWSKELGVRPITTKTFF